MYWYRNKKKRQREVLLATIISIVLLVLLFVFRSPVISFIGNGLDGLSQYIDNINLKGKNQEIERLNNKLDICLVQRNLLLAEVRQNKELATLSAYKASHFPKSIVAKVIARSPNSWFNEMIINKGSRHNIKEGAVVVTKRGLLGQVGKVQPTYSVIQLLSSSQVRFGGMVQRNRLMGVVFGLESGDALLRFVPVGSDVKIGDIVQTTDIMPSSNLSKVFPKAYPIGKVKKITHSKNDSELLILVDLFENGSSVNDLLVLI